MKIFVISFLLLLSFAQYSQAQKVKTTDSGFYLSLGSCSACGAYGNQVVRLLKKDGVNAFNGYAHCSGTSCFSGGEYASIVKIIRSKNQGREVTVMAGPFKTLDSAKAGMDRLKSILKPIFDGSWREGWGNTFLRHDVGNAYNIDPLSIYILKKN